MQMHASWPLPTGRCPHCALQRAAGQRLVDAAILLRAATVQEPKGCPRADGLGICSSTQQHMALLCFAAIRRQLAMKWCMGQAMPASTPPWAQTGCNAAAAGHSSEHDSQSRPRCSTSLLARSQPIFLRAKNSDPQMAALQAAMHTRPAIELAGEGRG